MDPEIQRRMQFSRRLEEGGIDNALILRRETAERVLTEKRMELLEAIATSSIESKRDLARTVDRDISIVSRDLDVLFEASVIEYEEGGGRQRPVLKHANVLVEPVVFEGEVAGSGESEPTEEAVAP
ncbi:MULTISPECIES: hypothetical protein [Halostella]|uniref:HVO_A0114 family putative DNA-binding protein n=1 Tax=Halostella TaxID=1843185 RepID=UPI001F04600C|nr:MULTISPECIES: hypothetical protein [Halostella]